MRIANNLPVQTVAAKSQSASGLNIADGPVDTYTPTLGEVYQTPIYVGVGALGFGAFQVAQHCGAGDFASMASGIAGGLVGMGAGVAYGTWRKGTLA